MALSPKSSGELEPTSSAILPKIVGGVVGAIVLFFVAKWLIGFVFTIVKFGVFVAIVAGVLYAISQFVKDD